MSEQIDNHILSRYEINKKIGSGAYGHVWKVIDKQKGVVYGLKKNFDAFQNSTDAQRTYRQIMFLQQFNHPNIIKLEKIIKAENDKDIYLVFQYMDIDMHVLIRQNILGERHKRYIMYQVAKALFYLHSADLVHRDIKPSNILVNQNCLTKICDFGLVRSVYDQVQSHPVLTEYIATRWYRAPEILLGSKRYSKAIDIWSFGCLLGQVVKGKPLFPGNSTLNQIQRVLTWTGTPYFSDVKALKTDFGKEILDLLSKIKPISKKQWLPHCPDDAMDLLIKTIQFNPEKRLTIVEILRHSYFSQFYDPNQIIASKQKIRTGVGDNQKLSLKEYRALIYGYIVQRQKQQSNNNFICSIVNEEYDQKQLQDGGGRGGVTMNRLHKHVRSALKKRDQSTPIPYKQGRSINIKKKYDSVLGGVKRTQYSKTKYSKTEEDGISSSINGGNKKKKEIVSSINKLYYDKKKKSVSQVDQKMQSKVIARYMYKNKYN